LIENKKSFLLMMVYRVDVNKNESSNTQERVIVIRGQQENCIQACREVLRIMYEDAKIKNKTK
jgi:hypothetical protein